MAPQKLTFTRLIFSLQVKEAFRQILEIAQTNYKPKKISRDAVLERIKDGTHIPDQPVYSNDPTGKGDDRRPGTKEIVDLIDKFEQINAKDKCLRVRFYD